MELSIITLIICTVCIFIFLLEKRFVGVIYNAVWIFGMLYVAANIEEFTQITVEILSVTIIAFNAFYLLSRGIHKRKIYFTLGSYSTRRRDDCDVRLDHRFFRVIIFITVAVIGFYSARTIAAFGFNLNAIRSGNNSDSESRVFNSIVDTILYYGIATSLLNILPIVVVYCYIKNIKLTKAEYAGVAFAVVLSVLCSAGRMLFVRIIIFIVAGMIWKTSKNSVARKISIGKAALIVAVIFGGLTIATISRNKANGTTFLAQVLDYCYGSIVHMEYQLKLLASDAMHFGTVVYGGFLYYPIKLLNAFLPWKLQTSNEILAYLQDFKMLTISGTPQYYNALVPNAFYYYFDSGMIGCLLFSGILAVSCAKYEYADNEYFERFYMFAICCYAVVFSILGGIMWSFAMPTATLFAFLLKDRLFKKIPKKEDSELL